MGLPKHFRAQLDGEELFNMYYRNESVEAGRLSYNYLHRYVVKKYGKNPVTGKDFSPSAVWQAAQRYLVRNYDNPEVEGAFIRWYLNFGLDPLTHEEYLHEVTKRAKAVFSPSQYLHWCEAHPDIEYLE